MIRVLLIVVALAVLAAAVRWIIGARPERVAQALRYFGVGLLTLVGGVLLFTGKAFLGMPILSGAVLLLRHSVKKARATRRPGQKSRVYADALMMELDLDSGEINGMVLKGSRNGSELNELTDQELLALHAEMAAWPESRELLETYLDRRIADWRDGPDAQAGAGLGTPPGSGPMTEQEAYEILGLAPGAAETEIRQAHRRLMKRVHPDTGGSAALASRLNAAKDFLLRRHV
ncbi:DnaJ domain-containing protein [Pseudohoeflea coraliihabitans]|uniref:DnaJ domain-containing protein n=1 Tax=Pseudohoeflea coraliihabitans TaxID=2860393 RepID=A0ABS6WRA9_9HYPH|nr:DnaJ domain-containing protein [Pseudohoeflea sp. DP4N28-3]MBW3098514.1 DnaJ domain-containing protein [Pseudohoeflea sp. DP4N28-3]